MQTMPLDCLSIDQAIKKQFHFVDCITRHLTGRDMLTRGDLGVVAPLNQSLITKQVEAVIAEFFHSDDSVFVRGAGTAAIREALYVSFKDGGQLLVHEAPVYKTTLTSIEMLKIETIHADFNHFESVKRAIKDHPSLKAILIQLTRQKSDDYYHYGELIQSIKKLFPDLLIITDDNYAVMKVPKIGVEYGADLSCFSTFKLLGPEGIGCVVGDKKLIKKIRESHYSGGLQTQGFEALEVLRGMTYAPVALAIQATVCEDLNRQLNQGAVKGVKSAFIASAQSRVVIAELAHPIASELISACERLGAAPHPVGAESKYELVPMIYRISGTFIAQDPSLKERMIRINPMRAGVATIVRILSDAIGAIECS